MEQSKQRTLRLLTVREAAEFLRVSKNFIYEHASTSKEPAQPQISAVRVGDKINFLESDLEKFILDNRVEASR